MMSIAVIIELWNCVSEIIIFPCDFFAVFVFFLIIHSFLLRSHVSWPLLSHRQGPGNSFLSFFRSQNTSEAFGLTWIVCAVVPTCVCVCVSLQEHLHFVTEICQDEVFILDHEGPPVSQAPSAGMPDLVVEPAAGWVSQLTRCTFQTLISKIPLKEKTFFFILFFLQLLCTI